jgi:type I restriction enzyme, S subunit
MIDFPCDWQRTTIGNVFHIKQGKSLARARQTGNEQRHFLRTSNVFWGRLKLDSLDSMAFTDKECSTLALEFGDLLVCEGGDIGRTAIWRGEIPDCLYQNHLHRLRRTDDNVFPLFVMFWLQAGMTQLNVYEGAGNKTTIPNLSRSRLAEFVIPLPPLPEQKKIAAVLLKLQQAISAQDKIIQSLRDLKKSTMHHLFTHGLRGEKTTMTEIGEIPVSWEVVKLGSLLQKTDTVNISTDGEKQIQYVDVSGVSRERLTIVESAEYKLSDAPGRARKRIKKNDVIFATIRPKLRRIAWVSEEYNGEVCSTAFCVLRCRSADTSGRFIYYVVQRPEFIERLGHIETGASYPAVTDRQVKGQFVPFPPKAEQRSITSTLDSTDRKLDVCVTKKAALQDLFKTTLNKLMTGDIRVADLDIDVKEVEG